LYSEASDEGVVQSNALHDGAHKRPKTKQTPTPKHTRAHTHVRTSRTKGAYTHTDNIYIESKSEYQVINCTHIHNKPYSELQNEKYKWRACVVWERETKETD